MFPISATGGAQAAHLLSSANDPHRPLPLGTDVPSFLMLIGRQNPPLPGSPPPFEPEPESPPEEAHPTVIFNPNEEGGEEDWLLRRLTPFEPSRKEDEIRAFGLEDRMEDNRVTCMDRHDHRGWLLWKYSADPAKGNQKDVLFTMGGPTTGKAGEYIDLESGLIVCCDLDHADIAGGQMNCWTMCAEYGYEMPDFPEESDEEGLEDDAASSSSSSSKEDEELGASGGISLKTAAEEANKYPRLFRAWELGDVEPTNDHSGGYPIWRAKNGGGVDEILFTTDPLLGEAVGMSIPPSVPHEPNQVHNGFETAFWGWWCFQYPRDRSHGPHESLMRGMRVRYGDE